MPKVAARPIRIPGSEKKRHKYNAQRTQVDGIWFDSKREAERYQELRLLERAGAVRDIVLQPIFALGVETHEWTHLGDYVADFRYAECKNGRVVIEDVKGVDTPLSKWKRKHVEAQYGITVQIVK